MTRVRRLAKWLSETVRTYASPGCVEWAEALEAELDVIESDWAALGWALGSLRVLLVYRERPWRTMADVEEAAERWKDTQDGKPPKTLVVRILSWLVALLPMLLFSFEHHAPGAQRAGYWLFVVGYAGLMLTSVALRRLRKLPVEASGPALIASFRDSLER